MNTTVKITKHLNLDNAATTAVHPRVYRAMQPYFLGHYYNPSSLYSKAREIRGDIIRARIKLLGYTGICKSA